MITMMISAIENDFQREFITEIYVKFYSPMLSKARSLSDNPEDAEEIVQDVFADLIKRVDSVMAVERKKLPAYLLSAVKFSVYTRNKKQSRWNFSEFDSEEVELLKDENAIVLVEWSENIPYALPDVYLTLTIEKNDPSSPDHRRLTLARIG